jgi:hypothetical protein
MATPMMLSGVSLSWKTTAEIEIVVTSFAIPAIDIGTTPARWMMLRECVHLSQHLVAAQPPRQTHSTH